LSTSLSEALRKGDISRGDVIRLRSRPNRGGSGSRFLIGTVVEVWVGNAPLDALKLVTSEGFVVVKGLDYDLKDHVRCQ